MARNNPKNTDKTRKTIVKSARKLFAKQGFAATTIAEICTASGYTRGALFHHFKTKEALFDKIWTDMEVTMDAAATAEVVKVTLAHNDPYEGFIAGCRIFIEHVSRPDFQQIVYIDGPSVLGMREWMSRDAAMGMRSLGSGLRYLASQGLIDERNRRALTILAYGALQGIAKAISYPEIAKGVTSKQMLEAFEDLIRNTP